MCHTQCEVAGQRAGARWDGGVVRRAPKPAWGVCLYSVQAAWSSITLGRRAEPVGSERRRWRARMREAVSGDGVGALAPPPRTRREASLEPPPPELPIQRRLDTAAFRIASSPRTSASRPESGPQDVPHLEQDRLRRCRRRLRLRVGQSG